MKTNTDIFLEEWERGVRDFRGRDLRGLVLHYFDLSGINFSGADLGGSLLDKCRLRDCNLEGANLEGAWLGWPNLEGANLEGANLEGTRLRESENVDLEYREELIVRRLFPEMAARQKRPPLTREWLETHNRTGRHLVGARRHGLKIKKIKIIRESCCNHVIGGEAVLGENGEKIIELGGHVKKLEEWQNFDFKSKLEELGLHNHKNSEGWLELFKKLEGFF